MRIDGNAMFSIDSDYRLILHLTGKAPQTNEGLGNTVKAFPDYIVIANVIKNLIIL